MNDTANTSAGLYHITVPSRDQVNMAMENRLAGRLAGIDPDVESRNRMVVR